MRTPFLALIVLLLCGCGPDRPRPGIADVVGPAMDCVVRIDTKDPTLTLTETGVQQQMLDGCGSGVVVDRHGWVLTCAHVVKGSSEVRIGNDLATVVAEDDVQDLALLHVSHKFEEQVRWSDTQSLHPGDMVIAVGFPHGVIKSASCGILSALGLQIDGMTFLTVDCAVNPGNSGGGLFDGNGRLIGLPARLMGGNGLAIFSGVAFAIPGNQARLFVNKHLP